MEYGSRYMRAMRKGKGFTLIELMVTVAVAAILLTVGVPSFQYILQSSRVSTQTNELVTGLSTARSEAIRRNQEVTVEPLGEAWVGGFRLALGNDELRRFEDFGAAISLDIAPDNVTFDGNGRRALSADTVRFEMQPENNCMGDMRRIITISPGGSVRTDRAECTDND